MKQYNDTNRDILENGYTSPDRTGTGTVKKFGVLEEFDLRDGNHNLLTLSRKHFKSIIHEVHWLCQGSTNINYLLQNKCRIWNEWAVKAENVTIPQKSREIGYQALLENGSEDIQQQLNDIREKNPGITDEEIMDMVMPKYHTGMPIGSLGPIYGASLRRLPRRKSKIGLSNPDTFAPRMSCGMAPDKTNPMQMLDDSGEYVEVQYFAGDLTVSQGYPIEDGEGRHYKQWQQLVYQDYTGKCKLSDDWKHFNIFNLEITTLPGYEELFLREGTMDAVGNVQGCEIISYGAPIDDLTVIDRNCRFIDPVTCIREVKNLWVCPVTKEITITPEAYSANSGIYDWLELGINDDEFIYNDTHVDQLWEAYKLLRDNPSSRRILINLWNPDVLPDDQYTPEENVLLGNSALPPCHNQLQFYTETLEDGTVELHSMLYIR